VDKNKDQSYFLYTLGQSDLARALFPVGGLLKSEVRKLAHRFALPVAARPDSQGLCFVGDVTMKEFLSRFITLKKGAILERGGAVIGTHDGGEGNPVDKFGRFFKAAVLLTLLLWLFLFRTDLGRAIRAVADNPYGALVIGTDVRRVYATAFGIGAACVGAAGALVSPLLPFQPATGLSLSITSFNIVIIGGMGSLLGAFIGGLLVSVAESLGAVFLAPSLKELVSFSLLILILLFRPAGLFGKRAP